MAAEEISGFRLSPQQEHLWTLKNAAGGGSWSAICRVEITGLLDPERLRRSLFQSVDRHEILRTTFRLFPGMGTLPLQVVETPGRDGFFLHCGAADPEALALQLAAQAPDTATRPALQADLIEVGPRRHLLLLRLSALCADRIGIENLAAEVARTYAGESPGAEPAQYADVAEVLARILEDDKIGTGREYWLHQVFPRPVAPELLRARPRVSGGSRLERSLHAAPEGRFAAHVASFAAGLRAVPSSVLLAAWQVVLGRLGNSSDFLLGVTFPGRTEEELEEIPGLFARSLPLRSRPAGSRRFEDLVAGVEEEVRTAAGWQDYFSWRCFGEGPGHPASPDLLPFGFDFLNAPATASAGGVTFAPRPSHVFLEPFGAELVVRWDDRRPDLELLYDGARLDLAEAHVLLEAVLAVLEAAAIHPGPSVGEIPLIREAQRHRLVAEWNDTRADLPEAGETLAGLFAAQATRTPERRAVELEDRGWTYGDLAVRTGQLAARLRRSGVGAEVRVGVLAERSPELICGLLAVAATGGAYVPLDPDLPPERLARIAQDAQPRVLLTDREPEPWLAALGIPVLALDDPADAPKPDGASLEIAAEPDHVAYVLYTSGSTGRPKGVMISHRAIVNRLLWMQRDHPLVDGDRVAQKTPIGFDASVWEIFLPLATGACVVLARPGGHRDGSHLAHLVARRGVTVLQLVPSVLRAWLDEPDLEESCRDRLRTLFCGGEALRADLRVRARERLGLAPHNLYGPTECAIDVASWPAGPEDGAEEASVPIGRPIANVRIHLLDSALQPVPAGALGELYAGGAGLARGYLGRPDLTAEKFLPDPFAGTIGEAGGRLYHTGDLARQRPDGTLEFLGRIDHQVKVNGVRVELGEIEATLLSHPAVGEAAVVPRQSLTGGVQLVAYVAPAAGCPARDDPTAAGRLEPRLVSAPSLRQWLGQRLPAAMVPADWIVLPSLPRLPSGKLDRQALPAADRSSREARGPRTPTEEILVGVWREVLGGEGLGVQDDFFQAGGHSLLAFRLVSRVCELFGIDVRVRALFESPTIELLAGEIERLRGLRPAASPPPIGPADRRGELPLSFSQQRIWFLEQLEKGAATHNLPLGARLEGRLDAGALSSSLQSIVGRHEALRTRFPLVEGRPVQRVWPGLAVALPRIDLTALPAAIREPEASRLAGDEVRRRFDLSAEPLLRVRLVHLEKQQHVLFAALSHIVGDGWSTGILVRELGALYTACLQGEASPLPELPIQYSDFACWQRQWLQGDILAEQLGYWSSRLKGAPQTLDLPADRSRPPLWTGQGARRPIALPRRISDDLVSLSRSRGASLFMTLLAGLSTLLHRYTGRRDLLIGSPIANRTRREVEPLIGLFANLLVLRLEPTEEQSFAELLTQVREEALSAFAHQDLPFERLVEELRPERDPSRPPLVQVVLVLQNTPWEPLELPGLRLSPFSFESGTTKFDLTLDLKETSRGIAGALEYSTDLFDTSTMARLAGHLAALLAGAVAAPEQPLSGLPLLTETERQQLASEWNDGGPVEPGAAGLHRAFEAWAARTPNATAVIHEDLRTSYGALNRRANRTARALQRAGCRSGDRVGLFADRSPELVLGILAILKAGGTYVPLDPAYPRERLELLCHDAALRQVVATPELAVRFPVAGVRIVPFPEGPDDRADPEGENLAGGDLPESIAYVIHTSGSTGRPKGVMVSHASVLRLFAATAPWFGFGPGDVWTLFHSFAFDFSVWEIWGALLHGGSLVIVPYALSRSPEAFLELLLAQRVTVLNQTPSALQQLIRTEAEREAAARSSLRWILLGGEALAPASLAPWFARHGYERPQVANLYGITETTVHTTFHRLQSADLQQAPHGAIGRPIPDLRVYVVDGGLALLPAGIPGELCVAGPGLALGYLDLPDQTAERFVPDPWSGAPGGRLYRSGDLARWRPDGVLEFLGRIDRQLKVRGFRIEPGEIEAALVRHPAVTGAAVTAHRDGGGALRLVAYFVAADSAGPGFYELRELLRESLPEPLVPSAFVRLETLPLTPNGKIDRHALPAPGTDRPELAGGFLEPRNALERVLAGIWSEVLGIEAVGVEDDFFDLGGHSLLATQVMSRLRQIFRVALPLRTLFGATTIARLAEALAAEDPRPGHSERVAQAVLRLSAMSEEDILRLRERRAASNPLPAEGE